MRPRSPFLRKVRFLLEELESRVQPAGVVVTVPLDPVIDQFGDQIATVMAYGDGSRTTFGIFDTGASAVTFSPGDQELFQYFGNPIPIKVVNGAIAGGIGGEITGDVSEPGIIIAEGMGAMTLSFDSWGFPIFTSNFSADAATTPGIQAFVGTLDGSPDLPTITGTPVLNPSVNHPNGLGARIDMQGALLDFSDLFEGLILPMPDIHFVAPGSAPLATAETTAPVYVPLGFFGTDNHLDPGDQITDTPSPMQFDVGLVHAGNNTQAQGLDFLLDTGAQLTVISTAVAEAMGLDLAHPETSITVQGVAGSVDVPGFTLSELNLPTTTGDTLQYTNVPVYVLDVAEGIDGLLGMNLFNTANSLIYDPFNPGGSVLGVTFFTDPDRGIGFDPSLIALLQDLGMSFFGGLVSGQQLPGFSLPPAPAPTVDITGPNDGFQGVAGQQRTFTLTASDPGSFAFTINWGDGNTQNISGPNGTQVSHTYTAAGAFDIRVNATDPNQQPATEGQLAVNIVTAEVQNNRLFVGGTTGDDQIQITGEATAGNYGVTVNGTNAGPFQPTVGVTVISQAGNDTVTIQGTPGDDTFAIGGTITLNGLSFALGGAEAWQVDGRDGQDRLTGPDLPTIWNLTGANAGNVNGLPFTNVEQLNGGSAGDLFRIGATASLAGRLVGGPGYNVLDYSAWSAGVTVDLTNGTATGIAGGIEAIASVFGGSGNDHLMGTTGNNILSGGAGDDNLDGGPGRDLLLGGLGADTINGGADEDLLISGRTTFDAQLAALDALMAEWGRTDASYAERLSHLRGALGGNNGTTFLRDNISLFDDGAIDLLTGGPGIDGFLIGPGDRILDWDVNTETVPSAAAPAVLSLVPNLTLITDAQAGLGKFSLKVVFNETMDTTSRPIFSFPQLSPLATLRFAVGQWLDATTYQAAYNVVDVNQVLNGVTVRVSGGRDLDGNVQKVFDAANLFRIVMRNPRVAGISLANANPSWAAKVTFRVTFSEDVRGVDLSDFRLGTIGSIQGARLLQVVAVNARTYLVTALSGVGVGTLRLSLIDNNSITNLWGNLLGGSRLRDGDFLLGQFYTFHFRQRLA